MGDGLPASPFPHHQPDAILEQRNGATCCWMVQQVVNDCDNWFRRTVLESRSRRPVWRNGLFVTMVFVERRSNDCMEEDRPFRQRGESGWLPWGLRRGSGSLSPRGAKRGTRRAPRQSAQRWQLLAPATRSGQEPILPPPAWRCGECAAQGHKQGRQLLPWADWAEQKLIGLLRCCQPWHRLATPIGQTTQC